MTDSPRLVRIVYNTLLAFINAAHLYMLKWKIIVRAYVYIDSIMIYAYESLRMVYRSQFCAIDCEFIVTSL